MDTEATRDVITRFLKARNENDVSTIEGLLTDDAQWIPPASSGIGPFNGREDVAKALGGGVAGSIMVISTVKRDVRSVIVDGDRAVVQQRLTAKTVKGLDYDNQYCWVYTVRDGKIQLLEEYADTLYASRVFGWVSD
jgi:uncharacterized protein